MFPLAQLHELAARRGDGLRAEFLELLQQGLTPLPANVARLPQPGIVQVGPNPAAKAAETLPENVVRFPAPVHDGTSKGKNAVSGNREDQQCSSR